MKQVSIEKRIAALERLEGEVASGRYQAGQRLSTIDQLLFSTVDFSESDLHRILRKSKYPPRIVRSIKLYVMMACLTPLCEPQGLATGPACAVKLIDFENLTRDAVFDVKGVAGLRLYFSLPGVGHEGQRGTQLLIESSGSDEINVRWHKYEYGSKFNAFDFLSPDQKNLYYRAKPFFGGQKRPTLQSLAANLLKDESDKWYGERSVSRYIQELRDFRFAEQDIIRLFLIRTVDTFGVDKRSMRQRHSEWCPPEFVTAIQRTLNSVLPFINQMQLLFTSIADRLLPHLSKGSQN